MRSFTSRRFREMYATLPDEVQSRARRASSYSAATPLDNKIPLLTLRPPQPPRTQRHECGFRPSVQADGRTLARFSFIVSKHEGRGSQINGLGVLDPADAVGLNLLAVVILTLDERNCG